MISIIVPIYKVETYLSRCVDSVLSQTYADYDLILVDDGSPDCCGAICESYAAHDSRIRVIHRENGGLSAARNSGIEWALNNSDSEFITFIDSDDWIHPRYLELLTQAITKTGLSVAVSSFRRTEHDGDLPELSSEIRPAIINTESFYCRDKTTATVAWGKLYRKEDFKQIRYPEGKIHEDELTTYKLLFKYSEIALVEQPLYQYFQNQQGIMRSGWNPKHNAEIEGVQEQLQYFLNHNLPKAATYAAKVYLTSIYRNLQQAKRNVQFSRQSKDLQKQLRTGLREYGKMASVGIQTEPWLYYEAFPFETIPYRIRDKMHRKCK